MNSLVITPICGLYREFYDPIPELLIHPETIGENQSVLDSNSLFWAEVLSQSTIDSVVKNALSLLANLSDIATVYRAILADSDAFVARVLDAKLRSADQGLDPQSFFSCVETLNIYCALYARTNNMYAAPFNIQNAWALQEDSSETIFYTCIDKNKNPYLQFIKSTVFPFIKKNMPKVIFLAGRPGYFSFAIARLLKLFDPSIFVCVTRHSSEYYSMNKIDHLLVHNTYLFQAFDAIILEHFAQVEQEITNAIEKNQPVSSIKNLILKSTRHEIQHTGYGFPTLANDLPRVERRPPYYAGIMHIDPSRIANVRLFPHIKCYWNKCNFCGINQKYHFENPDQAYAKMEQQLLALKNMIKGADYIWFTDEALPPHILGKIATFFIHELPGITWQARCRVEQDLLLDGLPELLASSGLRELRLGLESGSYHVLRSMNKFDKNFSFSLVQKICRRYSSNGISIHFPMIIGFPGETDTDRCETYDLLRKITETYFNVTFNINLFGLDVGSRVFHNWEKFDIQSITFPCNSDFYLGNILSWRGNSIDMERLALQRDQFMRETLYPWMPAHSITPPHIFYRLSETIRNTLVWKKTSFGITFEEIDFFCSKVQAGNLTVFSDQSNSLFYVYTWNSHHFMIGNQFLLDFIAAFATPVTVQEVLEMFCKKNSSLYQLEDLKELVKRLITDQYLILSTT